MKMFVQSLSINSENCDVLIQLAKLYIRLGQFTQAEKCIRDAISKFWKIQIRCISYSYYSITVQFSTRVVRGTELNNSGVICGISYAKPHKTCEGRFCHVMAFTFLFEMPRNRRTSISLSFLYFKTCHMFFIRNAAFSICSENLKCPIFPFLESDRKNELFQMFRVYWKWAISNEKHVTRFQTSKELKL